MNDHVEIPMAHGLVLLIDKKDTYLLDEWRFCPERKKNTSYVRLFKGAGKAGKQFRIMLHRAIMNFPKGKLVCHLDGNGLDCRRHNLAAGTHRNNGSSFRTKNKGAISLYRGVFFSRKRRKPWMVNFLDGGKGVFVGYYSTEEEAARAYDSHVKIRFGKFAHLNFPDPSIA